MWGSKQFRNQHRVYESKVSSPCIPAVTACGLVIRKWNMNISELGKLQKQE